MIQILLIVHLLIAVAMIAVVLLQRSEGGGLGIGGGGGGGGGMAGFMTGRGTANVLTRTTAILAALFMTSSIALAILTGGERASAPTSILDQAPPPASEAPLVAPEGEGAGSTGGAAGDGGTPSVPLQ